MTRKLNQTLFAGMTAFLAAGALSTIASADVGIGTAQVTAINMATTDDPARTQTPQGGGSPYLRKTDEEFTNEMHVAAIAKNKKGLSIEMRSGSLMINGALTPPGGNGKRMQGACAPIELVQGADGAVSAKKNPGEKFLTANNGNEYRNFNHPEVELLTEGTATQPALFLVMYNAQINGNDTKKYGVVVDEACNIVPTTGGQNGQAAATAANPGVVLIAKNNDDCSMNQDGGSGTKFALGADEVQYVHWAGCNGNGADDGWVNSFSVKVTRDGAGKATSAKVTKFGDVSVAKQEERSRGKCDKIAGDNAFVFCTYNQGNNQPMREGTWAAGLDVAAGKAPTILWTKQVEGRKELDLGAGVKARTYSSRIMQAAVLDGNLANTDQFILRTGDLQGNNQNNRKGGKYLSFQTSVVKVSRGGMEYVQPMVNQQSKTIGTDGTHLVMAPAIFGSAKAPGALFLQGSHTSTPGSVASARILTFGSDNKINVEPQTASIGAPYGRHLYSNMLGNNPGNQGRNFAKVFAIENPFYGQNGNKDKVLLIASTNGKDATQPDSSMKESTYISVIPVVSDAAGSTPGTGGGTGGGTGNGQSGDGSTDGDTSVGGCSTGSGSTGLASLLLLGLVAIRRRRA